MAFLDDIQAHLRDRSRAAAAPGRVGLEGRRAALWRALERVDPQSLPALHARWTERERLERFVEAVERALRGGIAADWPVVRVEDAIDALIRAEVEGVPASTYSASPLLGLELTRAQVAAMVRHDPTAPTMDAEVRWCLAVGAVDPAGDVTGIGRALTRLVGREAVHLALEVEVALSTGPLDAQRTSRSVLAMLRAGGLEFSDWLDPSEWAPVSYATAQRLGWFQIAQHVRFEQHRDDRFALHPDAADLVDRLLDPSPNPIRALAQALLDADRGHIRSALSGVAAPADGADLAYARLVVHELNNSLLPLSNAMARLWTALESPQPDPIRVTELRERIDRSLGRIQAFASDSARLAMTAGSETFLLRDVVESAVDATAPDRKGRIAVEVLLTEDARLEGPRGLWEILFVNLFRNAAQCRADSGIVRVAAEWGLAGTLHVYVDDDGPGVAEELRGRIFDIGVSQRGGSGLGLHEARATARRTGGELRYAPSPLGGARFHIQVPAQRVT